VRLGLVLVDAEPAAPAKVPLHAPDQTLEHLLHLAPRGTRLPLKATFRLASLKEQVPGGFHWCHVAAAVNHALPHFLPRPRMPLPRTGKTWRGERKGQPPSRGLAMS
jgi:hypothetical protein